MNIIVFYALEADSQVLIGRCTKSQLQFQLGASNINKVSIGGHSVFLVKLASGICRSAIIASGILQRIQVDAIVSVGPCGDLSGMKRIGDWHLINSVIGWQMGKNGEPDQVNLDQQTWGKIPMIAEADAYKIVPKIKKSVLLSGDAFISSADFSTQLFQALGGDLVDMNLAGIALAAEHYKIIRQMHLRVISDGADESAGDDFQNFTTQYDAIGGVFVHDILSSFPPDITDPMNYENLRSLLKPRN